MVVSCQPPVFCVAISAKPARWVLSAMILASALTSSQVVGGLSGSRPACVNRRPVVRQGHAVGRVGTAQILPSASWPFTSTFGLNLSAYGSARRANRC